MTIGNNRASRAGFTMVELLITIVMMGLVLAIAIPRLRQAEGIWGASRVAGLVANDLENAFSLASRQRRPVRLSCTCGSQQYGATDRATGATLLTRSLGDGIIYHVAALTFSTPTVDIYPAGIASAPLLVTVTVGQSTKQISMTQAGRVRVLP